MKKIKALLYPIIALAMVLLMLTGCGNKTDGSTNGSVVLSELTGVPTTPSPEPTDDAAVSEAPTLPEPTETAPVLPEPTEEEEDVFLYSEGIDENGFWIGITALDYVQMFNYQSMPVPNDVHAISDDAVQSEVDGLLASYTSELQVTDRAVIDGDTINIDFVGSIDGVEFENGSTEGEGADVTIGVTSFVDDFLEQLIGHMPGETVNVEVTFPDDYPEPSLQGKDALFVTEIHYIIEELEAELSDEFVAENMSENYSWTTVEEMVEGIRSILQKNAIQNYIQTYFTTEVVIQSVPDQLVSYQEKAMMSSYKEYAAYYGIELEDLVLYEGFSDVDEFIEANYESNRTTATYYLVSQAVAEDAGFSVNDDDLSSFFADYIGAVDYSPYEEQYGMPYLKQIVLCQKILDYIIENAVLED